MSNIGKFKCLQVAFRHENKDWCNAITGGYVTIEKSSGECYLSYIDTGSIIKRTTKVVSEASDMIPDAAMIAGRLGMETAKAFLGIKDGTARRQSAKAAARNMESLTKKYSDHKSNNYHLGDLENIVIKYKLTKESVLECYIRRFGTNALIIYSNQIEYVKNQRFQYEVCHLTFNNSEEVKRIVDMIQNCVPSITIKGKR